MVNFNDFEKFANPKNLQEVCFETAAARSTFGKITNGTYGFPGSGMNGIILYGPVGAGKTTLARMIPDLMEGTNIGMDCPWREEYNIAKGNSGVAFINSVDNFCYSSNLTGKYTYVLLNEVNNLSADAMSQLKSIMDNHQKRVVFIMTTNEFHKIEAGVVDRSYKFGFNDVPGYVWAGAIHRVLKAYGITTFTDQMIGPIAKSYNGSGRWFARDIKRLIDGYYTKYPNQYAAFLATQSQTTAQPYAAGQTTVPPATFTGTAQSTPIVATSQAVTP